MSMILALSALVALVSSSLLDDFAFPSGVNTFRLQEAHQNQLNQLQSLLNKAVNSKEDPNTVGADLCNAFSDSSNYLLSKNYSPLADIYVRFRYFQYESEYDYFFGEWVNTTTFGRFWYEYTSNSHVFRVNAAQYDELTGYKTMFDAVIDIYSGNVTVIFQDGDDGDVLCYVFETDFELDNRTFTDAGQAYLAMDDAEFNWILWGSRLGELCFAFEDFNSMYYLDGYDLFDDNEYRYAAEINETYTSITIYGEWLYDQFDSSEITVPDSVYSICAFDDEIEDEDLASVKLEQTQTGSKPQQNNNNNNNNDDDDIEIVDDAIEEIRRQRKLERIVDSILRFRV